MSVGSRLAAVGRITKIALGAGFGLALIDVSCLTWMAPANGRLVLFASLVVAIAALGVALLRRAGIRLPALIVLLASFGLNAFYLSGTGFDERNYDAQAHMLYIHRIADEHRLPMASDCTICHHPPLYHLMAAAVMVAANRSAVVSAPFALQVVSLGLFFVFVGFGILTVQSLTSDGRVQPWAAAFLAFWPVSVINSVRLNNDLLLFALVAAGMYYLVRWRRESSRPHLIVACVLAAAATFTKLNGLVLAGAIGGLLVWDGLRKGEPRQRARRDVGVVAALVLGLAAMGGARLWREPGPLSHRALGSAAVDESKLAPRSLRAYLRFDRVHYIQEPFSVARQIPGEDVPYWNHLLKSSLFGTRNQFQWGDGDTFSSSRPLARIEGGMLLLLIGYVVFAAAFVRRVPRDHRALSLYLAAWFLAAGLAFHFWAPKPHHTDFRFIYPVLIPVAAVFFEAVHAVGRRRAAAGVVGYVLLVAFWLVSASFFVLGTHPRAELLSARVLPGPKAEAGRPSSLKPFHWNRPPRKLTPR